MQCNCFLKHKLPCRDKRLVVGVKMRRFLPSTAVVLYFSAPAAIAADRYGEWLLEQPRSSALTLTFKQSVSFDNKIATSELGFFCDQRETSRIVGAVLIPFDGTFESRNNVIPVLFQKDGGRYDPPDLLQRWNNGTDYMFLESKDDVDELVSFLKTNDVDGVEAIRIFFPHDLGVSSQVSTHVAIKVSGFSDGFGAFQIACSPPQ
jgi:hypothetical protein